MAGTDTIPPQSLPARGARTKRRSRSGARTPCPLCGKHLRGQKGLNAHLDQEHGQVK